MILQTIKIWIGFIDHRSSNCQLHIKIWQNVRMLILFRCLNICSQMLRSHWVMMSLIHSWIIHIHLKGMKTKLNQNQIYFKVLDLEKKVHKDLFQVWNLATEILKLVQNLSWQKTLCNSKYLWCTELQELMIITTFCIRNTINQDDSWQRCLIEHRCWL